MSAVALVAGTILCLAAALLILFVVFKPRQSQVPLSRRRPNSSGVGPSAALAEGEDGLAKVTGSTIKAINGLLDRRGVRYSTGTKLELAGIKTRPADFIIWVGATAVLALMICVVLDAPVIGVLLAILVPVLARVYVHVRTERRQTAFDDQLGDTLQLLSGGLRAGHSMLHAIDAAARDSESPMSEELARVVNEARLGRDVGEALLSTSSRMKSEDFGWVAQAIEVNREAGGDLAEILDHVGDTIRDRNQIRRQVKSLSAEGRVSALVLFVLPIVVGAATAVLSPHYFSGLAGSPLGLVLLIVAILLLSLGGLWLRAVVKIKF